MTLRHCIISETVISLRPCLILFSFKGKKICFVFFPLIFRLFFVMASIVIIKYLFSIIYSYLSPVIHFPTFSSLTFLVHGFIFHFYVVCLICLIVFSYIRVFLFFLTRFIVLRFFSDIPYYSFHHFLSFLLIFICSLFPFLLSPFSFLLTFFFLPLSYFVFSLSYFFFSYFFFPLSHFLITTFFFFY